MSLLRRRLRADNALAASKYLCLREALDRFQIELVVDVGANVGQFARALRAIGYSRRIVSFEPVDEPFCALQDAAAADGNWHAHKLALGDAAGVASLGVMRAGAFSSFYTPALAQPLSHFSQANVVERRESVPVRRLDTVVDEFGIRWLLGHTLVKCDTQGHDRRVLEGMSYLNEVALLQVEISALHAYEEIPTMPEMIAYLDDLDFTPIVLSPVNRTPDGLTVEFDYLGANAQLFER